MPLSDIDMQRRRFSIGVPLDLVDFIVYSYNEHICEERYYRSVNELIKIFKNKTTNDKCYWIEVINRSNVNLPNKIKLLCEYFDIHPLTIEGITTLAPYMKLDLFYDHPAIYLLMKIISWNGLRVEQQQISFYLKCSKNILITFQEDSIDNQSFFDSIRNRLRHDFESSYHPHNRLKQMNIDYLFYCLVDTIIERYMDVVEEMGRRIDQFDEELMTDKTSLTLETFYSIYHLKHDLLHLRILCNPLKDIIYRLQRTMQDNQFFICSHTEPLIRLDMSHHFVRQQISTYHTPKHTSGSLIHTAMCFANKSSKQSRRRRRTSSVFLNENIYIYFSDLNDHIHQLIDSLDVQRENVSTVISFWLALSRRETEEILKLLTLITAVFMPCLVLTGISSLNFVYGPYYNNQFGYFVVLGMLATIITSMITWYKLKRWF